MIRAHPRRVHEARWRADGGSDALNAIQPSVEAICRALTKLGVGQPRLVSPYVFCGQSSPQANGFSASKPVALASGKGLFSHTDELCLSLWISFRPSAREVENRADGPASGLYASRCHADMDTAGGRDR